MKFVFLTHALFLASCVPYAWVTPPIKAGISGGVSIQERTLPTMQGRVGIYPFQFFPEKSDREIDGGVGYFLLNPQSINPDQDDFFLHGPYLDMSYFMPLDTHIPMRIYVSGKAQLAVNSARGGFGGSGQVGLEFFSFSDSAFQHCMYEGCNSGYAYGETAFSFFLEGTQFYTGNVPLTFMGAGLSFRSPATAGIGWHFFRDIWIH